MPVETTPAADNAVTRGERLPVRRQWRMLAPALIFGALLWGQLLHAGDGWGHVVLGLGAAVLTLLSLVSFVLSTERQRTLTLLRRNPWVEYPAEVRLPSGQSNGALAIVELRLRDGESAAYSTYPPDSDYQLGPRPVWCAGKPGEKSVALSLRQGACVSWARRTVG